jgi:hypothetical protein
MVFKNGAGPASVLTDSEAREIVVLAGELDKESSRPLPYEHQAPITAELTGSETCTVGSRIIKSSTPVLAMCRELISAGLSPDEALEVRRSGQLALIVRSLRDGARLEVNAKGTGFVSRRAVR